MKRNFFIVIFLFCISGVYSQDSTLELQLRMIDSLRMTGQYQDAEQLVIKILENGDDFFSDSILINEIKPREARVAIGLHKYPDAINIYREIIDYKSSVDQPNYEQILKYTYYYASCLVQNNERRKAFRITLECDSLSQVHQLQDSEWAIRTKIRRAELMTIVLKGKIELADSLISSVLMQLDNTSNHDLKAYALWTKAKIYLTNLDYENAINIAKDCVQFCESNKLYQSINYSACYSILGIIDFYRSDHKSAIIHRTKEMDIRKSQNLNDPMLFTILDYIGYAYFSLKEYEKAKSYYLEILASPEREYDVHYYPILGKAFRNLAKIAAIEGDHHSAENYFQKALNIFTSPDKVKGVSYLGGTYGDYAEYLFDRGRIKESLPFFKKKVELWASSWGEEQVHMAVPYTQYSLALMELNQFDEAFHIAKKARICYQFYPETNNISQNVSAFDLLRLLQGEIKAYSSLWNTKGLDAYRDTAFTRIDEAFKVIDHIRNYYKDISNDDEIARITNEVAGLGIQLHYDNYVLNNSHTHLEGIFLLMERAKESSLFQFLSNKQTSPFQNNDLSLRDSLVKYQNLLAQIEIKRIKSDNPDEINQLNSEWYAHKEKFDIHKTSFVRSSSIHKQLNEEIQLDLNQLSQILNEDELLIQYHLTNDHLYSLAIGNGSVTAIQKPRDKIWEAIRNIISNVNDVDQNTKEDAVFLYNNLIGNLAPNFEHINHIKILPDDILAFLPFELLSIKEPNKSVYLLEKVNISYAYSSSLLYLQDQWISENAGIAVWAPTYTEEKERDDQILAYLLRSGNYHLPGAMEEAKWLKDEFNAQIFIADKATVNSFMEQSANFQILHFSMHAVVDHEQPLLSRLLFQSAQGDSIENLTLAQLNGLPINADLAVLSACNTGFGNVKKGKAIESLSRSFSLAGVPSVVMSLWSIPDQSSSIIIRDFYNELKAGKSKDEALRNAKLNYLKNTKLEEEKHPFFWAGLVATGNMNPLELKSPSAFNSNYYWILALLAVLVLAFYWIRSKRS